MKTLVNLESYNGQPLPGKSIRVDLNFNEEKKIINGGKEYTLMAHCMLKEPTTETTGTCFVKVLYKGRLLSDDICVIEKV